ncbi:NAD(P)/FAD-dependent oxidoreductase [Leptospira bouyouniensis]|uniref:NADH-quinone oxidoreductase subunit D n=1 Tax=Leptospira bouyouniensis TaxID=2484911 RepID=A0ABY2L0Y5_9LEPT|nr:FAD-dependent oxidoreductase [Leptospira bouyouniensis]TGK46961.1 NADH-quinone oxidoreductase subunit D [Leptospira bouyouniensis]
MKTKIVILGAGYAGILCANRLEKQIKNVEIFLISDSIYFQERIRFHEFASKSTEKKHTIQNLIRKNINLLNGKVTLIQPELNQVVIETINGVIQIDYHYLVVSIGSSGIKKLTKDENSIQSKESVNKFLIEKKPETLNHLCILGGGLTGIELATEWKEKFPKSEVTIVDQSQFGKSFSNLGKQHLLKKFKSLGINIVDSAKIRNISSGKISFFNHSELSYDCLMNCTGFITNPLLKESGFQTNDKNQIYVDSLLRSIQYQNVFVAGDSAKLEHSSLRMGCVTALPMGAYVADTVSKTIRNQNLTPFAFQFFGRCVSLGRNDGLIQWTFGDDSPKEKVITGKLAAIIKELVNKFTIFSLKMEKRFPFRFYFWPKGNLLEKSDYQKRNIWRQGES